MNENNFTTMDIPERERLSRVINNTFVILRVDSSLLIYGESLTTWLSLGGIIRGDMRIVRKKCKKYYEATLSPSVFFRFIVDQKNIFEVSDAPYGYKVKIKIVQF